MSVLADVNSVTFAAAIILWLCAFGAAIGWSLKGS